MFDTPALKQGCPTFGPRATCGSLSQPDFLQK